MPNSSKLNFLRRPLFQFLALLLLTTSALAWRAAAQETGTHDRVYVVAHVDIVPNEAAAGNKLLQQYAADTRKEKGAVRIEVYVQVSRLNHFSVVEVWQNQKALEAHESAAHTKQFRGQIDPLLGSPYDERLHTILE